MYTDDILGIRAKYTNEYLLINNNYAYDIMWIGCRNNCLSFIKKMLNNKNIEKNKKDIKMMYETSLSRNNIKISSFLFEMVQDIMYKDMLVKCIINNSKKSLIFLNNKNIKISDFNEEYIVSECLRIGNYNIAKKIISIYKIEYTSLMYYIYVKKINIKMLIWLLNKIEDKTSIKFINIFNYINAYEFRKIFKIVGYPLLTTKYFNKCNKYSICKIMNDCGLLNKNYTYNKNIKILKNF